MENVCLGIRVVVSCRGTDRVIVGKVGFLGDMALLLAAVRELDERRL